VLPPISFCTIAKAALLEHKSRVGLTTGLGAILPLRLPVQEFRSMSLSLPRLFGFAQFWVPTWFAFALAFGGCFLELRGAPFLFPSSDAVSRYRFGKKDEMTPIRCLHTDIAGVASNSTLLFFVEGARAPDWLDQSPRTILLFLESPFLGQCPCGPVCRCRFSWHRRPLLIFF